MINGTTMRMIVNGVNIGATTSCTLNLNQANSEITSKDSDGWTDRQASVRSWDGSFDGFFDPTATFNAEEIFDLINGRTEVTIEFAVLAGGGLVFSGSAFVSNLTITAPAEEPPTLSGTFEDNRALAKGTVSGS